MHYYRPAHERGRGDHGWLQSRHTFSFADYHDPAHMGFSVLRVINDDRVAPGQGFGTHSHRDMEIVSYVLHGSIEHRDSMGNSSRLKVGEIQRMSAGTGVVHSEYNTSGKEPLRFLQIWIKPARRGVTPGYENLTIETRGALTPLVTPDGRDNTLSINQDATIYQVRLAPGETVTVDAQMRASYLHGLAGALQVDGLSVGEGDGVGILDAETGFDLMATDRGFEGLLLDLPGINGHKDWATMFFKLP